MAISYIFFLSFVVLVVTVEAQNCSTPVPGPNMIVKSSNTFTDGTKAVFACNTGYTHAGGSPTITCQRGIWTSLKMKCERKNCGSAREVAHGQVNYPEGTQFGDKAEIECDTGYRLVGKREIYCESKGWSGRLPVCEVVKCDSPPEIVNGTFRPDNEEYSYRDVVQYSCNRDYTLSGSTSRTCSEDGTFKPDPPTCVVVECEDPADGLREWDGGARPPYKFSSTVILGCKSGYIMRGDRTQTCDINSKWSPGLPTCEPKNCSRPAAGPNMILKGINASLETFLHGSSVSVACDVGYTSAGGSAVITCSAGSWSSVKLKCERRNCGSAGEVAHGQVNYPQDTLFGDKAEIECDAGYRLVGKREIYCGAQGWSGRLPVCEVVKCDSPPEIVNGAFSPISKEFLYGDVVQYSCNRDYTLRGSKSRRCSEDGSFKPDPPTCDGETVSLTCGISDRFIFLALGFLVGVLVTVGCFYLMTFLIKRQCSWKNILKRNGIKADLEDSKEDKELAVLSEGNRSVGST